MTENNAEYGCKKKDLTLEKIDEIREQAKDPNRLHGKDAVYALYQIMGMEIDYDDIPLQSQI